MLLMKDYYDKESETLYIADNTEPDENNLQYDGLPIIDGYCFHGYMTCTIPLCDFEKMMKSGENPVDYALCCIPAPATCALNRMEFIGYEEALQIDTSCFLEL